MDGTPSRACFAIRDGDSDVGLVVVERRRTTFRSTGLAALYELLTRRSGAGEGLVDWVRWVTESPEGVITGAEDRDVIVQAPDEPGPMHNLRTSATFALSSVEDDRGGSDQLELIEVEAAAASTLPFSAPLLDAE